MTPVNIMDGFLIINKPVGMTSHDVVNRVRRTLHTKKVGHAGTLDPAASGVLVVAVGRATKALQFIVAKTKTYEATLTLGKATDTFDQEGFVTAEVPFTGVNGVEETLKSFLGDSMQKPPKYAAIKVNGRKLYEYAREGIDIEVPPRPVTIYDIELLEHHDADIRFSVTCSKGTYIRSLCVDVAEKLGYPGYMSALTRMAIGDFTLDRSVTLEQLEAGEFTMMSLDEVFQSYDVYVCEDPVWVKTGRKLDVSYDHDIAVYDKDGHVLAVYGPDGQGQMKCLRGLWA